MAYTYDIFISYRRDPETWRWIKRHFEPLLKLRVGLELEDEPQIFIDQTGVESGTSWPTELGRSLAGSKILVALFTKSYFASRWCTTELSIMLSREKETARRTLKNPHGLVVPAILHDGKDFPQSVKHIQPIEIQNCFNVRMSQDSPRVEELDQIMGREASAIAKAIKYAPKWKSAWQKSGSSSFSSTYLLGKAITQDRLPGFSAE